MLLGQIATLAQSVERLTRNEKVDSSILSSGSLKPIFCLFRRFCASGGMVDAQDLGSCVLRRVGSSPISRTFCSLIASKSCKL